MYVILDGKAVSATNLIVLIRTAVATAHALPVNAIAKQAGRVKGATRSISRCTNAYPVALTTARTISNPEAASARDTGPVSIVHNQAVASIAGHTVPANRVFASATMIGPARNVIRNRAIHDARNMASARMELACAVKDGTDDIARCLDARTDAAGTDCALCKMANIVASVQPVGQAGIVAYDWKWNVMTLLIMIRMA